MASSFLDEQKRKGNTEKSQVCTNGVEMNQIKPWCVEMIPKSPMYKTQTPAQMSARIRKKVAHRKLKFGFRNSDAIFKNADCLVLTQCSQKQSQNRFCRSIECSRRNYFLTFSLLSVGLNQLASRRSMDDVKTNSPVSFNSFTGNLPE